MISKMIPWDVFSSTLQPWEANVSIACGTNTWGFNDPNWHSVAWMIWREYTQDFINLWEGRIGRVHVRDFKFHESIANALWIVCNEQTPWSWHRDNSSDWSQAGGAVLEGFTKIDDIVSPQFKAVPWHNAIKEIKNLVEKPIEWSSDLIPNIQEVIDGYKVRLNPIVRSVLIGSWVSWRENDANVAEILKAMQESPANIHLYLHAQEQMAQVARVVPLFPDVWALAAVPGYDDIRAVA